MQGLMSMEVHEEMSKILEKKERVATLIHKIIKKLFNETWKQRNTQSHLSQLTPHDIDRNQKLTMPEKNYKKNGEKKQETDRKFQRWKDKYRYEGANTFSIINNTT